MKRTALIGVGILTLGSGVVGCATANRGASESVATARTDAAPITGRSAVLTVHGMSCPLCANNVDKSLMQVPGVTNVQVNIGTGEATVALDGTTPVTRRQLAAAVDKSGFSLVDVRIP